MKPRDSQRQKVYDAERSLSKTACPGLFERFDEYSDLKHYVQRVCQSRWWKKYQCPRLDKDGFRGGVATAGRWATVKVKDGRGRRHAAGSSICGTIWMPRWSRYKLIILHELAHVIQVERPAHGRQFCRIFLDLVQRFVGRTEAEALKEAFRAHRVKYTKRRKAVTCTTDLL